MLTRDHFVQIDGVANIACGTLTLSEPRLWQQLGLPPEARVLAGAGMLGGGVATLCADRAVAHRRASWPTSGIAVSVATNVVWTALGCAAARATSNPWARTVLAGIAAYDASMAAAKTLSPRP